MKCLEGICCDSCIMFWSHVIGYRLPWKQLFEPVVNLSRDGFKMTEHNGVCSLLFSLLFFVVVIIIAIVVTRSCSSW